MIRHRTGWSRVPSFVFPTALFISTLVGTLGGGSTISGANAATLSRCTGTQIVVSEIAAQGGMLHAGLILRYRNTSATPCTMKGYPNVVGLNLATDKSRVAGHSIDGYLGGWSGNMNGKAKRLPLVILRAGSGVASSMVEWADCGTAQQIGCTTLTSLWVDIPSAMRPLVLGSRMLVSGYFNTTPFVPGDTGSAH